MAICSFLSHRFLNPPRNRTSSILLAACQCTFSIPCTARLPKIAATVRLKNLGVFTPSKDDPPSLVNTNNLNLEISVKSHGFVERILALGHTMTNCSTNESKSVLHCQELGLPCLIGRSWPKTNSLAILIWSQNLEVATHPDRHQSSSAPWTEPSVWADGLLQAWIVCTVQELL